MTEGHTARERLAALIERRALSHEQLATKSGVPRSNISKFLSARRHDMGFSSISKLARALDVSLDWLGGLPKRNPKELEPEEAELLTMFRALQHSECRHAVLAVLGDQLELDRRLTDKYGAPE